MKLISFFLVLTNLVFAGHVNFLSGSGYSDTKSIQFDGATNYLSLGNNLAFEKTDTFSFSFWVKFNSLAANDVLIDKYDAAGNVGYELLLLTTGTMIFQLSHHDGTNQIDRRFAAIGVSTGTWYHMALTYDGSATAAGVKFYLNGTEKSGSTSTNNLTLSTVGTDILTIGAGVTDSFRAVSQLMDEVSVWSVALSGANVTTIYNSGHTSDVSASGISGLTHWYRMGDLTDNATTVVDRVGAVNASGVNLVSGDIKVDVP